MTEAARNFADCVNQVHYQNASFMLIKNGRRFARLVPVEEKVCKGRDLVKALERASLTPSESRAWRTDLKRARRALIPPEDKWQ